jgi:membrane protein YdbS with pleckstrin-like domain
MSWNQDPAAEKGPKAGPAPGGGTDTTHVPTPAPGNVAPHRAADDQEIIYFQGSPLLRGEIGRAIWYLLASVGLVALAIFSILKDNWGLSYLIPIGLILVALLLPVIPLLLIKSQRYRISNYRIDVERGIFSRRIDTLELWHVDDIQYYQSLLDRILRVGTITVISSDRTSPRIPLNSLPNPRGIFESLKQRVIAVKRQRGVIKLDANL